jgi:hypothetical protein
MALVCFLGLGSAMLANPSFEKAWDMSYSAGVIALVIFAVIAATGFAVIIGALKMRKLRNHWYCRVTAKLAMLPLGLGVLFGLPCGIWALRLLKKPDVKAAFAKNADARYSARAARSASLPKSRRYSIWL